MGLLLLFALFVAVCNGAASSCSAQTSCNSCQQFTDATSPGTACDWCTATSSGLNVGCVAAGSCPLNTNAVKAGECPAPIGTCEQQNDCASCTARLSPLSTGSNPQNCVWCSSSYSTAALGCRTSCPSSYNTYTYYNCPIQASLGATVAISVFAASGVLGLLIGSLMYGFTYTSTDVKRLQSAAVLLHFISYVLVGAAPFSAAISMRISRATARKCCTCMPFWVYFLGIFEIMCVVAGLASGISIEASIAYSAYTYQYNYYGNFGGMFIVMIGIPTAVGGILAFGLPRVCISSCASRRKVKVDDDDDDDHRRVYSERSPLVDQPHHYQQQQQHHSQSHIVPQPAHVYPLTPSVNIAPVAAPAGYGAGPMHLQSPPSYQQQYPPAPQDFK